MSDDARMIRKLNWLMYMVLATILLMLGAAVGSWFNKLPPDIKLESLNKRVGSLESKLQVTPRDVLAEVERLRMEIEGSKPKPPPEDATNDN